MAYDLELADRVRRAVGDLAGVTEKAMFGGLAFLLGGKTFCGIVKHDLMVRVGPDQYRESLRLPHARPMDFTGRPLSRCARGARGTRARRWHRFAHELTIARAGGTYTAPAAPRRPS